MKRSKTAVGSYINRNKSTDEKKKPGTQCKLSPRAIQILLRIAQEGKYTAQKFLEKTGFNVSLRTVQSILHEHYYMEFGRLMKRPKLNSMQMGQRIQFRTSSPVEKIVFSDEKRFCLDGPDGTACFWADNCMPKGTFSKQERGGGDIILWAGIFWRGKSFWLL